MWQFTCSTYHIITWQRCSVLVSSIQTWQITLVSGICCFWRGEGLTQRLEDDWEGLRKRGPMTEQILASLPGVTSPRRNFTHFLQSGFNEQSNQRDTRQTITKRRQCLSDGPNVTDLRAAVCEGQAWHAAEQRGPRADPQSRLGNWLHSPDTSPLCSAATLTWNTHRLHQRQQLAYFHPSLPVWIIRMYGFVYFPSCVCLF